MTWTTLGYDRQGNCQVLFYSGMLAAQMVEQVGDGRAVCQMEAQAGVTRMLGNPALRRTDTCMPGVS